MSASQEKKRRAEDRASGNDKKAIARDLAERKSKRNKTIWTVSGIVVAVAIAFTIIWNSSLFYNNFTAVQIGDVKYTASEVEFYYNSTYYSFVNTYGSYLQAMGLDTTKSLSSQSYGEDQTWADFFREQAVSSLTNISILWQEAQKAGFTLSEEAQASLDSELASLSETAANNDYSSVDQFLRESYGKGLNYDKVKNLMEKSYIAQAYYTEKMDSFSYTDDELLDYYNEKADDYDNYNYVYYFVDGAEDKDNGIDSETAMANAKEKAEEILDGNIADADEFKAKVLALTNAEATETTVAGSSLSTDYAEWMKDASREEGNTEMVKTDSGYYVLYYIGRDNNDYNTVNVRHILIKAVADENGEYSDEAKKAAEEKAEELLAQWEDGAATEDSFAELASSSTEDGGSKDNGGLYEDVRKKQMVASFNDWCFDEDRQPGDTGIVFNEDANYCGYHVMYFSGNGDNYRMVIAENSLRSDDYNSWYEEASKNYTTTTGFTLKFVK